MSWTTTLFSGQGRLRRRDFWIAALLLAVLSAPFKLLGPIGAVVTLLLIYPQVCLFVKRLHDIGRSGWLTLLPWGGLLCGALAVGWTEGAGDVAVSIAGGLIGGLLVLAAVVFSLWVAFHPGDPGENRYGLSPKHKVDASVFA